MLKLIDKHVEYMLLALSDPSLVDNKEWVKEFINWVDHTFYPFVTNIVLEQEGYVNPEKITI